MMFPEFRVYTAFTGPDARERAENFKKHMQELENMLEPFEGEEPIEWKISEERE